MAISPLKVTWFSDSQDLHIYDPPRAAAGAMKVAATLRQRSVTAFPSTGKDPKILRNCNTGLGEQSAQKSQGLVSDELGDEFR
jgi:hypothetical protein